MKNVLIGVRFHCPGKFINRNRYFPFKFIVGEIIGKGAMALSKFKKSVIQRKKWKHNVLWICTSTHYVLHYYKDSGNSVERFQRSCANKKNSSIFHFGQISKFKKGVTPRKKWNQNFLWICTCSHYVLHN